VELALALCAARMDADSSWAPWMDVLPERIPSWLHLTPEAPLPSLSTPCLTLALLTVNLLPLQEAQQACATRPSLEPKLPSFLAEVETARSRYQTLYQTRVAPAVETVLREVESG
jgi:hypothetical protein